MVLWHSMNAPDLYKEMSEEKLSINDFLKNYNTGLPERFPSASLASLRKFETTYPTLFKDGNEWSLGQHRKKFMDWLT